MALNRVMYYRIFSQRHDNPTSTEDPTIHNCDFVSELRAADLTVDDVRQVVLDIVIFFRKSLENFFF